MSASASNARWRAELDPKSPRRVQAPTLESTRMVHRAPVPTRRADYAHVDLGGSTRVVCMLRPEKPASLREQLQEVLAKLKPVLENESQPMLPTCQTVFLRAAEDQAICEAALNAFYGANLPVTTFVLQPPCSGAAVALEVWGIGGGSAQVERLNRQALVVSYDRLRWVYCAGITGRPNVTGAYAQTLDTLEQMGQCLTQAGSGLEHALRTWFYLGNIVTDEDGRQRYQELNRARTDFYRQVRFCPALAHPDLPHGIYPASTGIGMAGQGLVASCLTLQTQRDDVLLLPLENPQQTPAYAYPPRYSPQSPKFSRAMALLLGDYVTTWISGTASIVNSESQHLGDLEKQTEQTIDNIQRLISPENFAFHRIKATGPSLEDVAKIRVYLKRAEDYERCRAVCERRFGAVPAIYAVADVCRPELLVEIEAVAFSRLATPSAEPGTGK